jgi:hypothetical protein
MTERLGIEGLHSLGGMSIYSFEHPLSLLMIIHGGDTPPEGAGTETDKYTACIPELEEQFQVTWCRDSPFHKSHIDGAGYGTFLDAHGEKADVKKFCELRKFGFAVEER